MRVFTSVLVLFFLSCGDSEQDGILGDWRAISYESIQCGEFISPPIIYNDLDDNNCLYTIYGYICDVQFSFSAPEAATLSFTDNDGNRQEIAYRHWELDDNIYSIFKDTQIDGRNWSGKIEGGELILGDNPFYLCDVYEFRWKRL